MSSAIACVVGARPNFVKMAPVLAGLRLAAPDSRALLVHTGQHYDDAMSDLFFRQLGVPEPDVHLEVGSGPHGAQTARVLERFAAWLEAADPRPRLVVVVGDVNSTLACALAAVKLAVPVAHVEAGLRSFDRTMPEEINRVVTDAVADLLLVSEPSGVDNLRREGRPAEAVRLVGNVMIDVLRQQLPAARALRQPERLGVAPGAFGLWTLHRPANVDGADSLAAVAAALERAAARLPTVFPVHPRTRGRLRAAGLWDRLAGQASIRLTDPLGYLEFLGLMSAARLVVTDSGGVQEETTALGVPCLTLRANTERPITVSEGTNTLLGADARMLDPWIDRVLAGDYKQGRCPALWDGRAGERIGAEIAAFLAARSS
jgi:UDP-N-acetylglucosamine 2-epimerase (non-hydrolysing)